MAILVSHHSIPVHGLQHDHTLTGKQIRPLLIVDTLDDGKTSDIS